MLFIATAIRSLKKLLDTHLGHVSNRQSINLSNSDGIKLAFRIFHEYFEKKEGRMKFGFKFVEKFHDCVIRITNTKKIQKDCWISWVFSKFRIRVSKGNRIFRSIIFNFLLGFALNSSPSLPFFSKRPRIYTEHCSNARHFYYTDRPVKQIVARGHGCQEARIYASTMREMRRVKGLWKQRQP